MEPIIFLVYYVCEIDHNSLLSRKSYKKTVKICEMYRKVLLIHDL